MPLWFIGLVVVQAVAVAAWLLYRDRGYFTKYTAISVTLALLVPLLALVAIQAISVDRGRITGRTLVGAAVMLALPIVLYFISRTGEDQVESTFDDGENEKEK